MDDNKKENAKPERRTIPTVSRVLEDGRLVELVYDKKTRRTNLAVATSGSWHVV